MEISACMEVWKFPSKLWVELRKISLLQTPRGIKIPLLVLIFEKKRGVQNRLALHIIQATLMVFEMTV